MVVVGAVVVVLPVEPVVTVVPGVVLVGWVPVEVVVFSVVLPVVVPLVVVVVLSMMGGGAEGSVSSTSSFPGPSGESLLPGNWGSSCSYSSHSSSLMMGSPFWSGSRQLGS